MLARLKEWARRLKRDVVTLWFAYRHARTPLIAKLCAVLVAACSGLVGTAPGAAP